MGRKFGFSVLAAVGLCSNHAWAASYVAIDLSSPAFSGSRFSDLSGGQEVGWGIVGSDQHALLWNGVTTTATDLNPNGFTTSLAKGTDGTHQVGIAGSNAAMWTGTAASFVNLQPAGYGQSVALSVSGNLQAGWATDPTSHLLHAMVWSGSAASAVDLNVMSGGISTAAATDGTRVIGYAEVATGMHATVWSGSAASAVDLNPAGAQSSMGNGIHGNQEVGWADEGPHTFLHAGMWTNEDSSSYLDLNPVGMQGSVASDTNGVTQVGSVIVSFAGGALYAAAWNGTAGSFVNLQQYLPANFLTSEALAIDASGNIAGYAYDSNSNFHAILWEVVPEPGTVGFLGVGMVMFVRRRR